ncbi:MAG: hypothetical protein KGQ79_05275 [Proteobacteria bacterium]|nr:hypothetical protein [Pseudomonadota bacterium]MBU6426236.1 hypothetical protein [Rhodospirillales bacterium]MDE2239670.1 hypothetical protein [Rhodospirillales bacterium]
MLDMKDLDVSLARHPARLPHGLSRTPGGGSLPLLLGLACAAMVMGVLWLAYTFG